MGALVAGSARFVSELFRSLSLSVLLSCFVCFVFVVVMFRCCYFRVSLDLQACWHHLRFNKVDRKVLSHGRAKVVVYSLPEGKKSWPVERSQRHLFVRPCDIVLAYEIISN